MPHQHHHHCVFPKFRTNRKDKVANQEYERELILTNCLETSILILTNGDIIIRTPIFRIHTVYIPCSICSRAHDVIQDKKKIKKTQYKHRNGDDCRIHNPYPVWNYNIKFKISGETAIHWLIDAMWLTFTKQRTLANTKQHSKLPS